MKMKGKFRDVIKVDDHLIDDRGWRTNSINGDFGKFLAAILKKGQDGITSWDFYIAIGKTANTNIIERTAAFKENIESFFENPGTPYVDGSGNWAWAKPITPDMVKYLTPSNISSDSITNILQIIVKFGSTEPDSLTRELTEFSLLAKVGEVVYLINYATHGTISKSDSMTLDRTVVLTFPVDRLIGAESKATTPSV